MEELEGDKPRRHGGVKFRRIRQNHEHCLQDIGRHPDGKELLIMAGFVSSKFSQDE
jgi:hypothetical protein